MIVSLFMILPVYLFSNLVIPELLTLQQFYGGADATANQLVTTN